jgi:hypothetical protein
MSSALAEVETVAESMFREPRFTSVFRVSERRREPTAGNHETHLVVPAGTWTSTNEGAITIADSSDEGGRKAPDGESAEGAHADSTELSRTEAGRLKKSTAPA